MAISKRIEEVDEVVLLLVGEADAEALIIEVHHVLQPCSRAIVEVGSASGQSPQDRSFDFADVGTVPGNQCAARIGDDKGTSDRRCIPG